MGLTKEKLYRLGFVMQAKMGLYRVGIFDTSEKRGMSGRKIALRQTTDKEKLEVEIKND